MNKMAETEGFEPSKPISGLAHLANECLQPLGHVSVAFVLRSCHGLVKGLASKSWMESPTDHNPFLKPAWLLAKPSFS